MSVEGDSMYDEVVADPETIVGFKALLEKAAIASLIKHPDDPTALASWGVLEIARDKEPNALGRLITNDLLQVFGNAELFCQVTHLTFHIPITPDPNQN